MAGLASGLSERNHQVTLITLDDARRDRHEVAAAVRRVPLDVMRPRRGLLSAVSGNARRVAAVRRAIVATRPDVVLSFCDTTNVLTLLSSVGTSLAVVVSERSNPAAQRLPWPWSQLRPRLYRRAAAVVVLTQAAADTVAPWLHQPPIVIPSAVEPPKAAELGQGNLTAGMNSSLGRSRRSMIAVGRLEYEKGFDRLLDAFAIVAEQHPDWTLSIHGEGVWRGRLEQQRDRLGLGRRVHFPGWTRPIWPVLQQSDLFVLPSRYEGFPSALLEAMAAGLACVAFDCPSGPGVIIRDGIDGLLVPEGDTTQLAAAMNRCMGDPKLRGSLASRASEVTGRFGWQAMIDAYERVLLSRC